ncbi:hypothetical protein K439DRAFT_1342338, partial [Ramaria rubella]
QVHICSLSNCLVRDSKGVQQCKRRAPWQLSNQDIVLSDGNWTPHRTYGMVNASNKAIMICKRSNGDIKLITNGQETSDITWYFTKYLAKKQAKMTNSCALLAKHFAYQEREKKKKKNIDDSWSLNKKLLQRCVNTMSSQQQLSLQEIISYTMGWNDCYISHHFVLVYWKPVVATIEKRFSGLHHTNGLIIDK